MHGKLSGIRHDGRGCLKDIPQGFKSTRYHSLSASLASFPSHLMITSTTEESGVIMGVRHRTHTLEAVQYHPESFLSEGGDTLLKNFLGLRGGSWEGNPDYRVLDPTLPPFPVEALDGKLKENGAESKIPTILEKIYEQRLKDVATAKTTPGMTPDDLDTLLEMHLSPPLVPLLPRLRSKRPALMAEIKRASPSKGPIAMDANAAQQALTYALSGAAVISVLTEPTWFKGSLLDMRLARQAVDSLPNRPAILRKDFILDEYQITEARLHGADTVLLIVAMLPPNRLQKLYAYSLSLGMEPLVEVNNAREMSIALELGAKVIGVNNRNLHNFEVDMGTTSRLADMVKEKDIILCALSGISTSDDVKRYTEQGVSAVLVGEALMKANDTTAFIRELLDWPAPTPPKEKPKPLVKICGIRSKDEAIAASEAGADMLGLMFVPSSKRLITLQTAQEISRTIRASRSSRHVIYTPPSDDDDGADVDDNDEPWFTSHAKRLSNSPNRPLLVGVFQDQPLSVVLHTAAAAQLDIVQLHGNEPVEWAKHFSVPVIRVFHVGEEGKGLEGITRPGLHQFVLVDSVRDGGDGLSGGGGKVVDLDVAAKVVKNGEIGVAKRRSEPVVPSSPQEGDDSQQQQQEQHDGMNGTLEDTTPVARMPVILAGGLTPENVAQAIDTADPWAVDVSGGVESEDGQSKDIDKLVAFVMAVKGKTSSEDLEQISD
jgi:anthranilate synthase/indole-3-glycerol phosphate synthase/phosphoribosylanthranilate isomerase